MQLQAALPRGTQLSQATALLQATVEPTGLEADLSRRHCAYLTHHTVAIEPKSPMKAHPVAEKSVNWMARPKYQHLFDRIAERAISRPSLGCHPGEQRNRFVNVVND